MCSGADQKKFTAVPRGERSVVRKRPNAHFRGNAKKVEGQVLGPDAAEMVANGPNDMSHARVETTELLKHDASEVTFFAISYWT